MKDIKFMHGISLVHTVRACVCRVQRKTWCVLNNLELEKAGQGWFALVEEAPIREHNEI